ncbi:MAG: hypothetical protein ACP5UQ_03150 [Anaerolineae bacterium]
MVFVVGVMFVLGLGAGWLGQAGRAAASISPTTVPAPAVQATDHHPADLAAPEASTWVSCTPNSVAAYSNRIHVRCNESYSGIRYFAYPTTNAAAAARYLSLLTSARVAGHTLQILYDPADTGGTAYGCAAGDCRPIQAVALY